MAAALALAYGLTDEYHQTFVPGRAATLKDIIVDGIGAFSAALVLHLLAGHWSRMPWKSKHSAEVAQSAVR